MKNIMLAVIAGATALVLVACGGDPTAGAEPREEAPPTEEDEPEEADDDDLAAREAELDAREAALEAQEAAAADEGSEEASEEAPEPVDEPSGDADVTVAVIEAFEPDEAWAAMQEVNEFNEPADDGFAYWMALVEVANLTEDTTLTPWDFTFYAEGPEGVVYDAFGCDNVMPDPVLTDVVAIRPGASQQGHVCFQMREADANAVGERVLWAEAYDEDFNELDVEWLN